MMDSASYHSNGEIVLHLLPFDQARGAQRYARYLIDALSGPGGRQHRVLTLFESQSVVLGAASSLGVPIGKPRSLGFDPRVPLRLRPYIRRLQPRVIVAHGGEAAKYLAASGYKESPWIYLKIGTVDRAATRPLHSAIHRGYTRSADLVVAVSDDVAAQTRRLTGIGLDQLVVIPNARDPNTFKPTSRGRNEVPQLLFVGHLHEGKRPDLFLDAVREVRRRGMEVTALMAGEGPLERSLSRRARAVGVEMLGRRDDVPSLMAASDVFVFTSAPGGEGMPGVLIEAGMSGLAAVSTRVPGAAEVIVDGETGILVDAEDKAALVEAVAKLTSDYDLRADMGLKARERCTARFGLDSFVEHWERVFDSLS